MHMSITLGANIVELYPGALRGYFQQASGTFDAHPDNLDLKHVAQAEHVLVSGGAC
jgi:hypothetical protein